MNTKKCNACGVDYPATGEYFYYRNKVKGILRGQCKECRRKKGIKHYNDNKQRIREAQKEYYNDNKERIRDTQNEYNKEYRRRPDVKRMVAKRLKKKRRNDPSFRMRERVTGAINYYLRKAGGEKNNSTWDAIPYTPEELKEHLESQFEDWMTWENYGNGKGCWNVDHIIPQSKLPYDSLEHPNFLKCWSLSNLRPLCSIENISKGNRMEAQ
jgi:hypothetical protein